MPPQHARLYPLLGIDHSSHPTVDEIRKAYLSKALELHPDKNPGNPLATARFQELKKAYETLISSVVTVENDDEDGISMPKHNWDSESEEEEVFVKPYKREAKKVEKEQRKEENASFQATAHKGKKSEGRELRDLERELAARTQKLCNFKLISSKQANTALELSISDLNARVLALRMKMDDGNRKKLRPGLGYAISREPKTYQEAIVEEEDMQVAFEAHLEEKEREEEFLENKMPMEFVDPTEYERVLNQRRPSLIAQEVTEMGQAQELAEKTAKFWNEKKATELEVKVPTIIPRMDRDPAGDSFKAAAVEYTKERLEELTEDEALWLIEQSKDSAVELFDPHHVMLPNDNLSKAHYCASKGAWKRTESNTITRKEEDHLDAEFDPLEWDIDQGWSRGRFEKERDMIVDGW